MKKSVRLIALLLLVVMCALTLIACGSTTDPTPDPGVKKKYTLTVWGAKEDQDMLKQMCAAYAAANPQNEYKFLFGVQSEADVADKILNDVTTGPDIYSFPSDQINKLFTGGALARIGGTIETNIKEVNSASSVDAATLTIGGEEQLFAYPSTADNCYFVYYDKRVFTDPSQLATLDGMLDIAEAGGKNIHFKLNDDGWYLSSFFFSDPALKYEVTYNENMVEESVDINFNAAGGMDVMKALRHYVYDRSGLVVTTDDGKIIAGFTPDKDGKITTAAAVTGIWNATAIEELLGENMGVCKLPTATIGGEEVQLSGYMGYKLIGVNGYSQNKGEAHKLAQWLTNEENQLLRFRTRGFGPTNKVVAAMQEVLDDPIIKVVQEQGQYMRNQKGVPSTYWTPMGALITPMITAKAEGTPVSDEDLQSALDALVAAIKK